MINSVLGKPGDRVEILGIGKGSIHKIRLDTDIREIYTVLLDLCDRSKTEDYPFYYTRHEELRWL